MSNSGAREDRNNYSNIEPRSAGYKRSSNSPGNRSMQLQPPQQPLPEPREDTSDDSHGVALKAAKDKWNELGPLRLEDIMRNSGEPID